MAIAAGLTLVAVPGARASTARVGTTGAVDYAAAPGEVNALRASVSGSTVTLADDGATIAAGSRCTTVTAHRRCRNRIGERRGTVADPDQ